MLQPPLFLLAIASILLLAAAVRATTADDLCSPGGEQCIVTGDVVLDPGSTIDVGDRELVIADGGTLSIASGTMTLVADRLTLESGGQLVARGADQSSPAADIDVEATDIIILGKIAAAGAPGGDVTLVAEEELTITGDGEIDVHGTGDFNGGDVYLDGADITVGGRGVNLNGTREDSGGAFDAAAGQSFTLSAQIDAAGGDGGSVDITSDGDLTVTEDGEILTNAEVLGGDADEISLAADGQLLMHGVLSATSKRGNEEDGAGDAGDITISGDLGIDISGADAEIIATAGAPDGTGGDVDISSSLGSFVNAATIQVDADGDAGEAGSIIANAGTTVTLRGSLTARSKDIAGEIDISSDGDMEVLSDAVLDAQGNRTADGGSVYLSSGGDLAVAGQIISDGGRAEGSIGGSIHLSACVVRVEASGELSSQESTGINTIVGRDIAMVEGTLLADRNVIRLAGPEYEPAISPAAQVIPAAELIIDSGIVPCNPLPTWTPTSTPTLTPTSTHTATPTDTPTVTPTRTPILCAGDCNGDANVSVAELIRGVRIALGESLFAECTAFDVDGSDSISIAELIGAVFVNLAGCPHG